MDQEGCPGEDGLDRGCLRMLGSSSSSVCSGQESGLVMHFPSSLPHHVSTVNQSQGGQASQGGLGRRAHRDPGCVLPWLHDGALQPPSVLDLQLAPRTLSSILHLPHPSHRPLGVSVAPRAVTTQHVPTRHACLCPGALSLSLSHDALRSPPLSW